MINNETPKIEICLTQKLEIFELFLMYTIWKMYFIIEMYFILRQDKVHFLIQ